VVEEARLKQLPLFAFLSDRQCKQVASHFQEVQLARGEHLVDEGQFAFEFFVIEQGTAAVVAGGKHVTDLKPGDFLGEIALVRGSERTASVIATSPITALVMNQDDFHQMKRSLPDVGKQIDAAIEERLERDRLFGLER
jgi:NTE family protein